MALPDCFGGMSAVESLRGLPVTFFRSMSTFWFHS
jgi:hypothetical protein